MARNVVSTGIGLRRVQVFKRDTDGLPYVPDTVSAGEAWAGVRISGALALTLNTPDPQRVTARGDDLAYHTFVLPPTELPTGELRVSKTNLEALALLTSTKMWSSSYVRQVGLATDKQGNEDPVIIWGSQQGVDSEEGSETFGQTLWRTYIILNALPTARPGSQEDSAISEFAYSITANMSTVDQLGQTFTIDTNGFTKAPYLEVVTIDKFWMDVFKGDGNETQFTLTQAAYVSDNDPIMVAVDGTLTSFSESNGVITISPAPSDGAKIVVVYTYSD